MRAMAGFLVACVLAPILAVALLAQQPTFKSGVDIVLVDVTVVDATGRPVDDLTPADFQVTVDRKPRQILSAQFLRYRIHGRTVPGERGVAAPAAPSAPASAATPPRAILIVVDEDSLEPGQGLEARKAAANFLERLGPQDRIGVATIPRLRSTITLSTRRSDVRKALAAVITGVAQENPSRWLVGLAEAFDVERGDGDAMVRISARECHRDPGWRGRSVQSPPVGTPDQVCESEIPMLVRQLTLQWRLRGQRSIDALRQLGDSLSHVDGPKTMVLISGGHPMPDARSVASLDNLGAAFASGQISLYTIYLQREQFGQVKNALSPTPLEDMSLERQGVENATGVVGGTFMDAVGALDQYFDRVAVEISGSYLLGVEVSAGDRDGRPHYVQVKVRRTGADVRAREQYVIPRERPAAAQPVAGDAARRPASPRRAEPVVMWVMTPEVEAALARAGGYATGYEAQFSGLVAEERYEQKAYRFEKTTVTDVTAPPTGRPGSSYVPRKEVPTTHEEADWALESQRTLKSDFLLVQAPGVAGWLPFRDVFEVDGKKVREREARLQKLFLEAPATAAQRSAEILAESARYNIGFVERNLNLPTLALRFLDAENRARFVFRKRGESTVAGVRTWEVAYEERQSPTLLRTATGDMPAEGSFWIDPLEGRVVRSTMRVKHEGAEIQITVTYGSNAKAGRAWVPTEMREVYVGTTRKLECVATYSNVRRFQVATEVQIPK